MERLEQLVMLHEYCQNRPKDHDANSAKSAKNPAKGLNHSLCSVYIFIELIELSFVPITAGSQRSDSPFYFADGAFRLKGTLEIEVMVIGRLQMERRRPGRSLGRVANA